MITSFPILAPVELCMSIESSSSAFIPVRFCEMTAMMWEEALDEDESVR